MSDADTGLLAEYVLVPKRGQPKVILWSESVSASLATTAHFEEMLWQKLSDPRHSGRRGNPRPTGVQLIVTLTGEPVLTVLAADVLRQRHRS